MKSWEKWYNKNQKKLNTKSRKQLIELSWNAAIQSIKGKPTLFFNDREVKHYEQIVQLNFENKQGFQFKPQQDHNKDTKEQQQELQTKLNQTNIINIKDWVIASAETPCIIELSAGDVIDYSALSNDKESVSKCSYAFFAILEIEETNIEVCELIEKNTKS